MTTPTPTKKVGGRKPGSTALTVSQKAEACALWRSGEVTLADLSKRFGKRPETFSRLFKKMGIEKGGAVAETTKKLEESIAARAVVAVDETLQRISQVKDRNYKYAQALAAITWEELRRAKEAGLKIEGLKETFQTLKLASEIFANTRNEQYIVLGVEEFEKKEEFDDLPELTVREMTSNEVDQVRSRGSQEMGLDLDNDAPVSLEIPGEDD